MKTRNLMAVLLTAGLAAAAWAAESGQTPKASGANGVVKGYRGVTIPLAGYQLEFVKKGDRVDVLVTFEAQMTDRKEKVTATILQNIVVVNIRKAAKPEETGAVELLLNPNEAQYLALSIKQGDVHLSLRAEGDTELAPMEMASLRKLFK